MLLVYNVLFLLNARNKSAYVDTLKAFCPTYRLNNRVQDIARAPQCAHRHSPKPRRTALVAYH